MDSTRKFLCAGCGSEVVDSNSERGCKFCPECGTTRSRHDVEMVYIHCSCCNEELDQTAEAQEAREKQYEANLEDYAAEEDNPDSVEGAMISVKTFEAFEGGISPNSMCVNCLQADCSTHVESCSYRKETTDPSECDHSFFPIVYGQHDEECRWCGLKRGES